MPSRDQINPGGWAKPDFSRPTIKTLVAAADTEPAEWRYTTKQPSGKWMASDFNDKSWQSGRSGFGTQGTPGADQHRVEHARHLSASPGHAAGREDW